MSEMKKETLRIAAAYEPQSSDETARALQELWSQVPSTGGGASLIKAVVREEFKALGVPVPVLKDMGKEIGKMARRRVGAKSQRSVNSAIKVLRSP